MAAAANKILSLDSIRMRSMIMIWAPSPGSLIFSLIVIISLVGLEDSQDVWYLDRGVARINNQPRTSSKPIKESQAQIERDASLPTAATTKPIILINGNGDDSNAVSYNKSKYDETNQTRHQDEYVSTNTGTKSASLDGCDFGGRKLRVAVSPQPPLVNCIQNLYGDWLCNGSNIEVIGILERRLNFQAEWIVLTSGNHLDRRPAAAATSSRLRVDGFGGSLPEKRPHQGDMINYTGVIGMVGSGRAWLSANGLMSTPGRQRDLLLSEPFDSFRLHLLLSKSVRDHDHIFIKPFSANAWLAILGSSLLVVPIFYLTNTTSSHYTMLDDKFLSRISFWACIRYLLLQAKDRCLGACSCKPKPAIRRHSTSSSSSSSSSSSTSFDNKLDKLVAAPDSEVWPEKKLEVERRRRRRALRHRWTLERRRARRAGRANRKSGFFKVAYVVWYVMGSLANQGGETEDLPHASSTRILIAFWWLYLIVICSIHSGILTAILTFPKQSDFIQNLDDFMAIGAGGGEPMKLLVDRHSEPANLLSDPDNLHKSPLQLLMGPGVDDDVDGNEKSDTPVHYPIVHVDFQRHRQRILDEVQRGQSAYLEEKSTINLIITQEYFDQRPTKCQFKSSRFPIDIVPMALVLSRQFSTSCVSSINRLMRNIMRTGLAQKWRRNYEASGNDCLNTVVINAGDFDKIELKHVELAFWLLLAGLSFGAMLLIIEVVWLFTAEVDDDTSSSDSTSSSSSSTTSDDDDDAYDNLAPFQRLKLGHKAATTVLVMAGNGRGAGQMRATAAAAPLKLRSLSRHRLKRPPTLPASPIPIEFGLSEEDATTTNLGPDSATSTGSPKLGVKGDDLGALKSSNKTTTSGDGATSHASKHQDRKRKRAARAAQRRARRLRRTIGLVRRLQEGKIYSDFFMKVSGNVQNRARRASQAIVSRLAVNVPINSKLRQPPSSSSGGHLSAMNQSLGRQNYDTERPDPIRRRRIRMASGQVVPSG